MGIRGHVFIYSIVGDVLLELKLYRLLHQVRGGAASARREMDAGAKKGSLVTMLAGVGMSSGRPRI